MQQAVARARRAVAGRVASERRHLLAIRSRPVMADPVALVDARRAELEALADRAHRRGRAALHRAADQVAPPRGPGAPHTPPCPRARAQVRTLSPLSTLERGYAVVQQRDGHVVTDQDEVEVDELLRVRVARGDFAVRVAGLPGTGR